MNQLNALRPEMELLLLGIQAEVSQEAKERIEVITRGPLDWSSFLALASWHTLAPLLYSNRANLGGVWPPGITAQMRHMFTANSIKNLFLTAELAKLVGRFEEMMIPVLAYKGPLLTSYYGDPGAREFHDLDLLIRKEDLRRVDRMLEAAGLQASEQRLPFARAFDFELTYESEAQGVYVDLHWSLMPRFFALPPAVDGVWDRAVTAHVAGRSVKTLGCEDSVLFLCVHGTKHVWESLGWVCDIARVLRAHPDLDWDVMFSRARELRVVRALSLGLLLAAELLGARVPEPYWSDLAADRRVRKLADSVYRQLFEDRSLHWSGIASSKFLMDARDNFADALRCAAERILQPTTAEWRSVRFPRRLFALYYPLRIFRLLTKHTGLDGPSN